MPTYAFINFDEPNATTYTFANGINNAGQVVGSYDGTGFLMNTDGSFQDIAPPGSIVPTVALGINNAGQIVGSFTDGNSNFGTFLRAADGSYAAVATPDVFNAAGLNDAGQLVGSGTRSSFVINADGTKNHLTPPGGADKLTAYGINNAGQVVGSVSDGVGLHAFVLDASGYSMFDNPLGAGTTAATAINDAGGIVGYFTDGNFINHAFLDIQGAFLALDDPAGIDGTVALGINNAGAIVGYYFDATDQQHASLALPSVDAVTGGAAVPEPGSVALLGAAGALFGLFGCHRQVAGRRVVVTATGRTAREA